jgi:hypothetical protein
MINPRLTLILALTLAPLAAQAQLGALSTNTRPSAAWVDASITATATANTPATGPYPTVLANAGPRSGLHIWNDNSAGGATACMNYTAAAVVAGIGCAIGSIPIPAGSAYFEDQPGNASPEAVNLICAGAACPLTIKVR